MAGDIARYGTCLACMRPKVQSLAPRGKKVISASPHPNMDLLSFACVVFGVGFRSGESCCDPAVQGRVAGERWLRPLTKKSQIGSPTPGPLYLGQSLLLENPFLHELGLGKETQQT